MMYAPKLLMDHKNKCDLNFGALRNPIMINANLNNKGDAPPVLHGYNMTIAPLLGAIQGRFMDRATSNVTWVALVERIRNSRDTEAFSQLFNHFAPRVKAFLIKSGAPETVAEDCAQDVMITLWRKAHMFDPSRASVATWIFTIARNRRIDILRKDARAEPEALEWGPMTEPDAADVLEVQQESEQLSHAIDALPEKQRQLILSAYYGDLSHSEIATKTGLPLGTIKSRIRLALDRLRQTVKQ